MSHAADQRRITEVLHVLAPMREGGLERVVTMLAAGQIESGVHVAAVLEPSEAQNHPFVERLAKIGVPITILPIDARGYVAEYRAVRELIAKLDPRLIHTHGYRADIIAGAAARRSDRRHISTVHGFTGAGAGFRNRIYETLQRFALRRSDAVIAVSAPLVQLLAGAGVRRSRIHCIQNGFVGTDTLLARRAARARLCVPTDEKIVGWIGRLSGEKGADVMIDALAVADPSWKLSIIGEGAELASLRTRAASLGIADRINWHGSIADAASLITAFDAFVLSSRTEGTPIVLFEAMHAGVPIVATSVGGVPDVVGPDEALLIPADRPDLIASALSRLVADQSATARRVERARARLNTSFGHTAWLDAVARVYALVSSAAR